MADGTTRRLDVEVVSDTGFHLGTGLYFGFDGHHHGEWRGELHADGERIADCSEPATARRVHQIRDTVVRITDPAVRRCRHRQLATHDHRRLPGAGPRCRFLVHLSTLVATHVWAMSSAISATSRSDLFGSGQRSRPRRLRLTSELCDGACAESLLDEQR